MLCFVGCGGGDTEQPTPPETPQSEVTLKFIDAPSTITMGEAKSLIYVVSNNSDQLALTFESSNTGVVTIDNLGNIEAISVGQAEITAKCGTAEAKFTLNVVKDDGVPQFLFNNYINETDTQSVSVGGKLNLSGYVFYNGRNFTDATVSYTADEPNVISVDANGVLTGLAKGDVTLTITASWREMSSSLLTKKLDVSVVDYTQILLKDGSVSEVELYTIAEFDQKTYSTNFNLGSDAQFMVNGQDVTSQTTFTVIDNQAISGSSSNNAVELSSNVITAVNCGTATLKAEAVVGGQTISQTVPIKVNRPVKEYSDKVSFSVSDGEFVELEDMFGGSVTLAEAYQSGGYGEGTKLTLDGNRITNFNLTDKNVPQDDYVTLFTAQVGVKVNMTAYYKVIRTASDLASVYSNNATAATTTTGYFFVANDIPYDANVAITPHYDALNSTWSTFSGVFDGNGKTIEYAITRGGLFDTLRTATIKNASFIVKAVPAAQNGYSVGGGQFVILARNMVNTVVENVYARYDCALDANITNLAPTVSRGVGLFGATSGANCEITNTVLDLSNVTVSNLDESTGFSYGVIWCPELANAYGNTAANVHVIWTNKTLYQYSNAGGTVKYFATSSNDKSEDYAVEGYTAYENSSAGKACDISTGITRHDDYTAVGTVGNWSVGQSGATWVK